MISVGQMDLKAIKFIKHRKTEDNIYDKNKKKLYSKRTKDNLIKNGYYYSSAKCFRP